MTKLSSSKRALTLANTFNLMVAVYFVIIAIIALIQLRWYHQLTVSIRVRHLVTSASSYFAFLILIVVAIILTLIFVLNALSLSQRSYISPGQDAIPANAIHLTSQQPQQLQQSSKPTTSSDQEQQSVTAATIGTASSSSFTISRDSKPESRAAIISEGRRRHNRRLLLIDSSGQRQTNTNVCYSTIFHLLASIGLIVILIIWLFNTGELVRDSISNQLDAAFLRYQYANRSNHYSIAIDGMQNINNCCGSLEYTDFPHRRSGLSTGYYPGSCCGKAPYGVNARVLCTPEEVVRAKQTKGCVHVLADYYDLISLLIVPVAFISLFINISIIALITITKVYVTHQDIRMNSGESKLH